ncbi:hypothetical protein EON81_27150 [bacterium]|nr:MAG: hypothetical protein EON81_27150 [bacterium]
MRGFDDVWLPTEVLAAFPPDREAPLRFISPEITDEMLIEMAQSDSYGDPVANLIALKSVRDRTNDFPEGAWVGETTHLFLYSLDDRRPPWEDRQIQIARAFCACCWVGSPGRTESAFADPYEIAFPNLMRAGLELGPEFRYSLARLLTWSIRSIGSNHREYLPQIFALFSIIALESAPGDPHTRLLADWIERLSEQYAIMTILYGLLELPYSRVRREPWRAIGVRNLQDRLPLESELRFELGQVRPPV